MDSQVHAESKNLKTDCDQREGVIAHELALFVQNLSLSLTLRKNKKMLYEVDVVVKAKICHEKSHCAERIQ